ncbi:MAG: hypothetical protein JWO48_991, partial [Bryobacterales bacterium]|nr:hypothetical protein [Bryobacterales bacterium]
MRSRHALRAVALSVLLAGPAARAADSLPTFTTSLNQINFQVVAGRSLPPSQQLSIAAPLGTQLKWAAAQSDDTFQLNLTPSSGLTPAKVDVGLQSWWATALKPGTYKTNLTITAPSTSIAAAVIAISLTVNPALPLANFTYLAGPNNCTAADGYPDAALCTVSDEAPAGHFKPPKPGGSYIDPNFGAPVKIMAEGGCVHTYSTPSPVSAHGKYMHVFCNDGEHVLYTSNAKVAYPKVPGDPNIGIYWDGNDDEVYYYTTKTGFNKYDLRTQLSSVIVDYSKDGHNFAHINTGGTGDSSKDNWIPFWFPDRTQLCVLNVAKVLTYCADYSQMPGRKPTFIDFGLVAKGIDKPTGKRYVLMMANPSIAAFSVNEAAGKLDFEFRGPELTENLNGKGNLDGVCDPGEDCLNARHSDVFEDEGGVQYLVTDFETETPCARSLVTLQLNKGPDILTLAEAGGGRRIAMTTFRCGDTWSDDHIGCAKSAPFCVLSTNYTGEHDAKDNSPNKRAPHLSELFVMRGNGLEIRRLAQTRSVPFKGEDSNSYWTLARAAISNDGRMVIADSNFGVSGDFHVLLIQTGFGSPTIANAGVLNAANGDQRFSPGSMVSIYGTSLAGCTKNTDTSSLPNSICGTTITVAGAPALVYYIDPSQANVLVPTTTPLTQNIPVIVTRSDTGASTPQVVPASFVSSIFPAIFTYTLDDQVPRAVIQNSDSTLNGPLAKDTSRRPLQPGENAVLFASGLGETNP